MVKHKQKSAADFPKEFLDAWNLAASGKLLLTMDTIGQARSMIQRLYTFRKRLMEEAPEMAAPFYLVDLRVHDEAGNIITGKPTNVPQKAVIKVYSPAWKEQIRKQALEGGERKINEPMGQQQLENLLVPVLPIESSANSLNEEVSVASGAPLDNLSKALSNAGYSTEK